MPSFLQAYRWYEIYLLLSSIPTHLRKTSECYHFKQMKNVQVRKGCVFRHFLARFCNTFGTKVFSSPTDKDWMLLSKTEGFASCQILLYFSLISSEFMSSMERWTSMLYSRDEKKVLSILWWESGHIKAWKFRHSYESRKDWIPVCPYRINFCLH